MTMPLHVLIFSNYCRGLGTVTVPSGVQGQSPCM